MKKKVYEVPKTVRVRVLTEGTFASSIADDGKKDSIKSNAQGYNEYTAEDGFNGSTPEGGNFTITWE